MLGIDKFDLQQRLVNTFLKRIKEQKWSELSDLESLDLVNSCYILVSVRARCTTCMPRFR